LLASATTKPAVVKVPALSSIITVYIPHFTCKPPSEDVKTQNYRYFTCEPVQLPALWAAIHPTRLPNHKKKSFGSIKTGDKYYEKRETSKRFCTFAELPVANNIVILFLFESLSSGKKKKKNDG
jgi:hypothetical protein